VLLDEGLSGRGDVAFREESRVGEMVRAEGFERMGKVKTVGKPSRLSVSAREELGDVLFASNDVASGTTIRCCGCAGGCAAVRTYIRMVHGATSDDSSKNGA